LQDESNEHLLTLNDTFAGTVKEKSVTVERTVMEEENVAIQSSSGQALKNCIFILRFLQLLCEGHHTALQNYLRD